MKNFFYTLLTQYQNLFLWLGIFSIITFIGTLLLVPLIIIRMPADYFVRDDRQIITGNRLSAVLRIVGLLLKNILGVIFMLSGFVMLFIPGQGLLTIFIGLMLVNFPGKRKIEYRIISNSSVLETINKMRRRANRLPLKIRK